MVYLILRRLITVMITMKKIKDSEIKIRIPKDEKAIVTERAASLGMTTSDYIRTLINKEMINEK